MNYKEALQNSLETFTTEEFEYDDPVTGEHVVSEPQESLPITFASFIMHMASIMVWVADSLLMETMPDIFNGEEKIENGEAIEKPIALDYMRIFAQKDFSRSTILFMQLQPFIEWLLPQAAETEKFEEMWYDADVLSDKWNEFAISRNNRK